MTRKAILERANVLNAASLQANTAMAVVASSEPERPEVETATYKCGDCNMVFSSNAGDEPFCVACGSQHATATTIEGMAPETLPADDQLAAYACAQCGTYNVLSQTHLAKLDSHAHCVSCGVVHNFDLTASEDDGAAEQQQDQGDQQQEEQQEQDASAAQTTASDEQKPDFLKKDGDQQQDEQQQAAADDEQAGDEQQDEQQEEQQEQDASAAQTASDDTAVETVPLQDDELLQDGAGAEAQDDIAVELSLLATALTTNPKAELKLAHTGDSILAMVDGLHVATLHADAKPEFAGVFDKAPFARSIIQAAADHGIVATLNDYGFVTSKVKVPVAAATKALIRRGVAAETAALKETTANLSDDLKQALSIAASALNKGFWKSKSNPLKAALAQALASVGVANPNRMLTNVFASSGDAYVRTLLECALDLSKKSVEFRNEIAASLQDMNVQDDQGPDLDDDDGELATASFDVPAKAMTAAVAKTEPKPRAAPTSIRAIQASVGGSLFAKR